MFKSFKSLLGLSLLAFFGVWMGCSSDSSPVSPSNKAVTDDDGSATQVSTFSTDVSIPDDSLRVAVTQGLWALVAEGKIDIPTGTNPLTTANLAKLETLTASGKGIVNLSGLEHATDLKSLNLNGNNVEDLAPLANLTKLEYLSLENNLIPQTGYSHLANLTKLTNLRIGGHRNADIGSDTLEVVVENMTKLTALKVNHMGLTDISFLEKENLKELRYLNLNGNREITNLKPLACLPNLNDLRVERVGAAYNTVTGEVNKLLLFLIGEGVYVDYIT